MSKLVPISDLPDDFRLSVKPGDPTFQRYARELERQYRLLPGSLSQNSYTQTDPLALLEAAAYDIRGNNLKARKEDLEKQNAEFMKRADPTLTGGELQFGPWNTGIKTPPAVDRFLAGMGKSFSDTALGLRQLTGNTPQGEVDERARLDAPLMDSGLGLTGYATGALSQVFLPGSAAAKGAAKLPAAWQWLSNPYVQAALIGGGYSGTQPVESGSSRGGQMAVGALSSLAGQGIGEGMTAMLRPAWTTLDQARAALAEAAVNKYGIPLRASDINPTPVKHLAHAATDALPGSGSSSAHEAAQKGYNRALAKTMGQETDDLSAGLRDARADLGKTYDALAARNTAQLDPQRHGSALRQALDDFRNMDLSPDKKVSDELDQYLGRLVTDATPNPVTGTFDLSGDMYKKLRTQARQGAQKYAKTDPDLAGFYHRVKEVLDDSIRTSASITPEDAALYRLTDKQWGNMRTLENIAPKDASGDADFGSLARVMLGKSNSNVYNRNAMIYGPPTGNDLVTLARIGTEFGGKGPAETNWHTAGGFAKGVAKASLLPAAVGGLYATNLHDEDPVSETAKEATLLGLGALVAGRGLNSRWFAEGAKFGTRPAVDLAMRAGAPRALLGYTLGHERGAVPEASLGVKTTDLLGLEPSTLSGKPVPADDLPDEVQQ